MRPVKQYKTPTESLTIKTEIVCPNDSNPMGILQGGRLIEWMDIAAAVSAQTHAGNICVTASIQQVDFKAAAKIGDIITIHAVITRSFKSSMEIFVQAFARKVMAGEKYLVSEAYLTFVALDESGQSTKVLPVKPQNNTQRQRYSGALLRKRNKIKIKNDTAMAV